MRPVNPAEKETCRYLYYANSYYMPCCEILYGLYIGYVAPMPVFYGDLVLILLSEKMPMLYPFNNKESHGRKRLITSFLAD